MNKKIIIFLFTKKNNIPTHKKWFVNAKDVEENINPGNKNGLGIALSILSIWLIQMLYWILKDDCIKNIRKRSL